MLTTESPVGFSLLGGPLHQLGRRLGLVRGDTNTVLIGLTLGGGLWLVIVALAVIEGTTDRLFSLSVVAGHARLLLVIPLYFICESWVDPRMAASVATLARSGVVPGSARPALEALVSNTRRLTSAWWPEAVCLLAAIVLEISGAKLSTYGTTGAFDPSRATMVAFAYFRIGLTLFRFLLFRWAWKLALWCWFLWRVSRLDLQLLPGHPDRDGGLTSLEGVHERFTPLVAALSVLVSASLAESISTGALAVTAVYPTLAMLVLLDGVLFLAPLLVFTDKLWESRTKGTGKYNALAARYVAEFEAKWTDGGPAPDESLVGTPDLQALADLGASVASVRAMRWIPVGPRLLTMMSMAAFVPLAPLLLFQYPIEELAKRFFTKLVGL